MECVARAALDGAALLQPLHGLRTNVFAYARRPLHLGEQLEGVGGYTCYGLIENCVSGEIPRGLPICLADDVVLKRDVAQDESITLDDVEVDTRRIDFDLYRKAVRIQAPQTPSSAL
jgi:predicted homoserine dehydrogenase-like protein